MLNGHAEDIDDSTITFELTRGEEGGFNLKLKDPARGITVLKFIASRSSLAEAVIWMGSKLADKYRETPYMAHTQAIIPSPQPRPQPAPPPPQQQQAPSVVEVERFPSVVTGPEEQNNGSLLDKIANRMYDSRRGTATIAAWAISLAIYAMAMGPHA